MQEENPKVSVIVTTFNRKKLLLKTLNSIVNQTYKNLEIIVVDNYSDYNFFGLIKSLKDSRIKAYQNNNNGIIAINRNYGSKVSSGSFLAFCDDDDIWFKDKIYLQLKIMLKSPEILLNATLAIKSGYKSNFGQNNFGIMYRKVLLTRFFLLRYNPIILSSVMVKKDVFISLNGFSEDEDLVTVEDLDLWLKFYDSGKISILKQILLKYEIHNSNVTKLHFQKRMKYLSSNSVDISKMKLPFETNKSIIFLILRSVSHLLYIITYKIINVINRSFYIDDKLIVKNE